MSAQNGEVGGHTQRLSEEVMAYAEVASLQVARQELVRAYRAPEPGFERARDTYVASTIYPPVAAYKGVVESDVSLTPPKKVELAIHCLGWMLSIERNKRRAAALDTAHALHTRQPLLRRQRRVWQEEDRLLHGAHETEHRTYERRLLLKGVREHADADFALITQHVMGGLVAAQVTLERDVFKAQVQGRLEYEKIHPVRARFF